LIQQEWGSKRVKLRLQEGGGKERGLSQRGERARVKSKEGRVKDTVRESRERVGRKESLVRGGRGRVKRKEGRVKDTVRKSRESVGRKEG
jgi:hypothetical protein